jgi:hypothetical protein
MTGFASKRQAAQDKLQGDDAQGYIAEYEEALLIAYQSGFADGKRSAQRPWIGLTDGEKKTLATAAGCTDDDDGHIVMEIFRLAEIKLKEKNDH